MAASEYDLNWSPSARAAVLALAKEAVQAGQRHEFAEAVKTMEARLRSDPLEFGEPYREKGPVVELLAAHESIGINFSVHTGLKEVMIRICKAASAEPLS